MAAALSTAPTLADSSGIRGQPDLDSAHSVLLDAVVTGELLTKTPARAVNEIKSQLQYTVGPLNEQFAALQLGEMEIRILSRAKAPSAFFKIRYEVKSVLAWDREQPVPATLAIQVPDEGSPAALTLFFRTYKASCRDTVDAAATYDNFWYHYRPSSPTCKLRPAHATTIQLALAPSTRVSEGRFPEYGKVWEDGKLVATIVVGKEVRTSASDEDWGVKTYQDIYGEMVRAYGAPTAFADVPGTTKKPLKRGEVPGYRNPAVRFTFTTARGPLDVSLDLVDNLATPTAGFVARYNQRTPTSDVIAYFGHAGLGANIRALSKIGVYSPGQYQIFLVNGCDTFSYVDQALAESHAKANPGSPASKHLDVITNALSSAFESNGPVAISFLNSLIESTKTYREMLATFDPLQKSIVDGEQDNVWPADFNAAVPPPSPGPTP